MVLEKYKSSPWCTALLVGAPSTKVVGSIPSPESSPGSGLIPSWGVSDASLTWMFLSLPFFSLSNQTHPVRT